MTFSDTSNVCRTRLPCTDLAVLVLATFVALPDHVYAVNLAGLVKKISRVSDEVPINRLDDVVQDAATSRAGREILEEGGVRLDDAVERSRAIRKAWQEVLGEADVGLLRQIDELDEPTQQAALVLARGARSIESGIPDLALRSRFLSEGGGETLAALGRYDDLIDDAIRFDTALRGGRLPSPQGTRTLALGDFGRFFQQQGSRARHFWLTCVRPNWKLWLGGSALAAVILTPDEYLDDVGDLTQKGLEKIGKFTGELLGKALAGTIEGVGKGAKSAIEEASSSIFRTFLSSPLGVASLVLVIVLAVFLIPFTRVWAIRSILRKRKRTESAE